MSCIPNSVCKFCRRENMKLFLKGTRCDTPKCAIERRNWVLLQMHELEVETVPWFRLASPAEAQALMAEVARG